MFLTASYILAAWQNFFSLCELCLQRMKLMFKAVLRDPRHFGVDPDPDLDPLIHASDQWIRIWQGRFHNTTPHLQHRCTNS
jgi:hypothetical protein